MQDLLQLMSAFTAKPWRGGVRGFFAFVFRTRAWAASRRQSQSQVPALELKDPSSAPSASCVSDASSAADAEAHIRVQILPDRKPAAEKAAGDVKQDAEQNS